MIVPSVIALWNAHKQRLQRIAAKAYVPPQPSQDDELKAKRLEELRLANQVLAARKELAKDRRKSVADAVRLMGNSGYEVRPRILISDIVDEVCDHFRVTITGLRSSRRDGTIITPRHIVCYLARKRTEMSTPAIGRYLGNRDHTTILSASQNIERILKDGSKPLVTAAVAEIEANLDSILAERERDHEAINSRPDQDEERATSKGQAPLSSADQA